MRIRYFAAIAALVLLGALLLPAKFIAATVHARPAQAQANGAPPVASPLLLAAPPVDIAPVPVPDRLRREITKNQAQEQNAAPVPQPTPPAQAAPSDPTANAAPVSPGKPSCVNSACRNLTEQECARIDLCKRP